MQHRKEYLLNLNELILKGKSFYGVISTIIFEGTLSRNKFQNSSNMLAHNL